MVSASLPAENGSPVMHRSPRRRNSLLETALTDERTIALTTFTIEGRPEYVRDRSSSLLSGFYPARFLTDDGRRIQRYLTDKGRAEVLRRLEAGQRELSEEEFDRMTVDDTLDALLARTDAEAGEGA